MKFKKISTTARGKPSVAFLGRIFCGLGLLCLLYLAAFFFQIGAPVQALWWLKNVLYLKEEVATQRDGNRIIILSASNALMGINSEILENRMEMPVVNLSISGLMGMPYMTYLLDRHVKPGDKVIMPLEAQFYKNANPYYYGYSNNVLAWAHDYQKSLPSNELIELILRTDPQRILHGVKTQLFPGKINRRKTLGKEDVLQRLEKKWAEEGNTWKGFTFQSVNEWGDMLVDPLVPQTAKFKRQLAAGEEYYGDSTLYLSETFMKQYRRMKTIANERGADIFITWAVMTPNRLFNLEKPKTQNQLIRFAEMLKAGNITIHCNPALFYFEPEFFYDTVDHLNRTAANIRTNNLVDCLLSDNQGAFDGNFAFVKGFKHMDTQQETARRKINDLKKEKMQLQ